jgi:hypothetical protein
MVLHKTFGKFIALLNLHPYGKWPLVDQHFVQAIRVKRSGGGRVVHGPAELMQATVF